ncbi:hypothetical protein P3X46_035041 [Hevea brasiliensis]|uniref:Leucine-rich repeat-containing N-terminal plant-type domain-containing protein n=1 Tax=Hevea brasiliensis TaxID=3981 RepID=A0ABQ9K9T7_HEVBR|nr:hypothetical protein P3X46_035041 [Hevea brasiliensis]
MASLLWLAHFLCFFLFHLHFQASSLSFSFNSSSAAMLCQHDQSLALLQFKKTFSITSDASPWDFPYPKPYPKTGSWKEGKDCCWWDGVACDIETGNVIGLNLSSSLLYGTIHSNNTLFFLPHLQKLDLSNNHFNGSQIVPQFGQFFNLSYLNLNYSVFEGRIPLEISYLSGLVSLDLSSNYDLILKATVFNEIVQNLTQLQELDLSYLNLSSVATSSLMNLSSSISSLALSSCELQGKFPDNIIRRPNLQLLDLSGNEDLTGSLPRHNWNNSFRSLSLSGTKIPIYLDHDFISNLKSLETLELRACNFGGSTLELFGNLTQLINLDISHNNLSGQIPSSLGSLEALYSLDLSYNNFHVSLLIYSIKFWNSKTTISVVKFLIILQTSNNFTGPITFQGSRLSSLVYLDLSNNLLHGRIPSSIFKLVNLNVLILSSNKLIGEVSSAFCELNSLQILDLSNNSLNGSMPQCLGNFSNNLSVLHLGMNKFHGTILETFSVGSNLRYLKINGNQLQGRIPPSISNCINLEILDLGNNNIDDTFPHFLETLSKLQILILKSNKFHGLVKGTSANYSFPKLRIFDLSNNLFSGPLPAEYFNNFKAMMIFDLNMKYMGAPNHSSYDYSVSLTLKGLEIELVKIQTLLTSIDLSGNKFTGEIPQSIGKLKSLKLLNLSHNQLTGNITIIGEFEQFGIIRPLFKSSCWKDSNAIDIFDIFGSVSGFT